MNDQEETFDELADKASNKEETLKILEQLNINNEKIKEKEEVSKKPDSFLTDDEVVKDIGNHIDVEKINEKFIKKKEY